jgi:NAD(P)-dependent dehydrogenase (short-subunit alcohol dehydrogenase family)
MTTQPGRSAPSADNPPPAQQQQDPGTADAMSPQPADEMREYTGRRLLDGRRALITGGHSGIGRAVAVAFAKEGADVAIAYLSEQEDSDAQHTAELVQEAGHCCVLIRGDLAVEDNCRQAVRRTAEELGGLDILVNNVATQSPVDDLGKLSSEQWERTFRVNVFSYFWTTRAALDHLHDGGCVINTASINGLRGNKSLIDYAASKGAVLALTYSLAQSFQDRGIRVNSVAPGPVWTPLIPSTFPPDKVEKFGQQVPMGRARRDRPFVCVLRRAPAVELLLGRSTGSNRRRDAARLTRLRPSRRCRWPGSPHGRHVHGQCGRFPHRALISHR